MIHQGDYDIHYTPNSKAVFFEQKGNTTHLLPTFSKLKEGDKPKTEHTPEESKEDINYSGQVAFWGEDNLRPFNIIKKAYKNTIIPSTQDWKVKALYAQGLVYGIETTDEEGNTVFKKIFSKKIQSYTDQAPVKKYLATALNSWYWFKVIFCEIVLSRDRKTITSFTALDPCLCRFSLQKNGRSEYIYVQDWRYEYSVTDKTIKIKVLDPYRDLISQIQEGKDYKYILPIIDESLGSYYYPEAEWLSLDYSGWLDFANMIPVSKKSRLAKKLSASYIVEIAAIYWVKRYPDWDSFDERLKIQKKEEFRKTIEDFIVGAENAGGTLFLTAHIDEYLKEWNGYVKITPVEDPQAKGGELLEDSQEASSHALFALGVDSTLIATAPGKGIGDKGGSNKREAFNMYQILNYWHEQFVLTPYFLVATFNGWEKEYAPADNARLTFNFQKSTLQTLDMVTPSQRETTPNQPTNN